MSLDHRLKELGFTPNESRVYLFILEKGSSTPPLVAKALRMPRSNIHYILQGLVEKSVLKRQTKGKRFVYVPTDPAMALEQIDRKREIMAEIVPDLEALYKKNPKKPVVKFYEGIGEVSKIFDDILNMKECKLVAFASISKLFSLMPEGFPAKFQKDIKRREIFFQEILSHQSKESAEEAKRNMFPFHEYKILSEKYSDFPTDFLVWDDSVALITLSEPIFGVVITSKPLADTYRLQFEIMWRSLDDN